MTDQLDRLSNAYAGLTFGLPQGLIHGDAHRSNLLKTSNSTLLLDFEVVSFGPREWDLTPTALSRERFGLTAEEYAGFVRTYGHDVMRWDGYRVMAKVRELTMTTWLMQNITEDPRLADEFTARVADIRSGSFASRCQSF